MSTRPNWKTPLILAAVLFVGWMGVYWLEFKHKPEKESKDEAAKKIFLLKDTQIQSMKIVDGRKALEVECLDVASKLCKPGDNSKWQVTEPSKLKADDANSNAFVSTLNNLVVSETIDLKDETAAKRTSLLKEYGLDDEARKSSGMRRVEVMTPAGGTVLYLGQPHPVGEAIFAAVEKVPAGQKPSGRIDENLVYLIPTYFKSNFDHDLTYWRDKKLLTLAAHEVDSFKLTNPKTTVSAERKDGQWVLHARNEEFPGDIENIDSMLSGAAYLSAKDFASDDKNDKKAKAALKGTKPVITFLLQKEKGTAKETPPPVTLTIYEKPEKQEKPKDPKAPPPPHKGKVYATVSNGDPLYELEGFTIERFSKDLKDLRLAKLITSMDRFTAKKLQLSGHAIGETLVLNNKDGKWQYASDKNIPGQLQDVDASKVSDLLDKLSGNRIREYLTGKAIPSGEEEGVEFALFTDKPEPRRRIVFWKKGEMLYAHDLLSSRKEVFAVDTAISDALPWNRNALFKPPGGTGAPAPKK